MTMPERLRGLKVGGKADVLQDNSNVLPNAISIARRSKVHHGISIGARIYTSWEANRQYQEHLGATVASRRI